MRRFGRINATKMFNVVASDFDIIPYELPDLDQVPNAFPNFVDSNIEEQLRKMWGNYFYELAIAAFATLPAAYNIATQYNLNDLIVSGSNIYKSLQAVNTGHAVSDGAWWELQPDDRWLKLREGDNYTYTDYPYTWLGMHTMLVPMIYSLWTKANVKVQTGAGIVINKNENSEVVGSGDNIVRGWNKFCDYVRLRRNFFEDSLYGYLYANSEQFDDLFEDTAYQTMKNYLQRRFCAPGRQNVFDI